MPPVDRASPFFVVVVFKRVCQTLKNHTFVQQVSNVQINYPTVLVCRWYADKGTRHTYAQCICTCSTWSIPELEHVWFSRWMWKSSRSLTTCLSSCKVIFLFESPHFLLFFYFEALKILQILTGCPGTHFYNKISCNNVKPETETIFFSHGQRWRKWHVVLKKPNKISDCWWNARDTRLK